MKMELIRGCERQYAAHVTGGRRGLTQEALLERMGSVNSDYAEPYSHATRGEFCTTVIAMKIAPVLPLCCLHPQNLILQQPASGNVSSPIVTCRSCIASNNALCTFGGALLTSSASTRFEKTGPF